jgi:peptide methionine sulfoxide reductase MsrB
MTMIDIRLFLPTRLNSLGCLLNLYFSTSYYTYGAFYHKSNIDQQIHKKTDMYKMYCRTPTCVRQVNYHLQGLFFSRELQELFTSNFTVNGYTLKIIEHTYIIVIIKKCVRVRQLS